MPLLEENKTSFLDKVSRLNWTLISLIFALCLIGIMMLYSAAGGVFKIWLVKQIIYLLIFFPVMILVAVIDIKFWFRISYLAYFFGLILLVVVVVNGHNSMGATRWFKVAGITMQPSEVTKFFTILALAKYFYDIEAENIQKLRYVIIPVIIIAIPSLLILDQPDLGTAVVLVLAGVSILFLAGVKAWKFITGGICALITIPFLWYFVLYDYQKDRILIFLSPDSDPSGAGYNITQSKIAIGSGGLFGKGYLNGTQGQLDFLPERQTDFIFTMLNEEMGFIGGVTTLILYLAIIQVGARIALRSQHQFGKLLAMGVVNIFFFHMFVNMGMVMGLLPIVGIPLPLISYGGTMTATMLISFGLLLNVDLYHDTELTAN